MDIYQYRDYQRKKKWRSAKRARRKRMRASKCTVYGLYDCENKLRYIGQTRNSLKERMKDFRQAISKKKRMGWRLSPVEKWIEFSNFTGQDIHMKAIDENATWDVSEIIYIERAKAAGADLLNVLRGGNDQYINLIREGIV